MTTRLKAAPSAQWLIAASEQSLDWKRALGELIDNAFDAGASTIQIGFKKNALEVSDDGNGCDDLAKMLTLGKHFRQSSTSLGRYGIGLKEAALWIGGVTAETTLTTSPELVLETVHNGIKRGISINWFVTSQSPDWDYGEVSVTPATHGARGTKLLFRGVKHRTPDGERWRRLVEDIGYLYSPAIKQGKRILLSRVNAGTDEAPRLRMPELFPGHIDTSIAIGKRKARVFVGMVRNPQENTRPGITYMHGFRVILENTGLGCGDASTRRVWGFVELKEGWRLSKNKDDIGSDKDELGAAVYGACKSLLDKIAADDATVKSAAFATSLTEALRGLFGAPDKKAFRDKGDKSGSIEPIHGPKKHKKARKLQPGERIAQEMRGGKLRVEFAPSPPDDVSVGRVDPAGERVILHENHPYVQKIRAGQNHDAGFLLVLSLVVGHDSALGPNGQRLIPGIAELQFEDRFAAGLGDVLSRADSGAFALPKAA
jgi:hypothetical protein